MTHDTSYETFALALVLQERVAASPHCRSSTDHLIFQVIGVDALAFDFLCILYERE